MANKPINLRLRRKQKMRDEKRTRSQQATDNSGVTKADRQNAAKLTRLQIIRMDGHRLKQPDDQTRPDDE